MPTCTATLVTRPGHTCDNRARHTQVRPLCYMHHKCAMKNDTTYRTAYNATQGGVPPVETAVTQAELRAGRVASNERRLAELSTSSITDIMRYSRRLITLWFTEHIAGFDLVKAYTILRYHSFLKDHYRTVLEAAVKLTLLANGYHPDHQEYKNVPQQERTEALERLSAAIELFGGDIDITILSRQSDANWPQVQDRIRIVEAQEAAARREAERQAFQLRLQRERVVFKRDPEGSIDLRQFASDPQSIHRSSVQTVTERAVHHILSRPVLEQQETLDEICTVFLNPKIVKWRMPCQREAAIDEIKKDYLNTEAFSIRYSKVLDHVWSYIAIHESGKELCIRLAQEVFDGIQQCSNGKMARLVNVLQGFDDTLELPPSPEAMRLMFQNKISRLTERPIEERQPAALSLFEEYSIPKEEHEVWLAPLLE